MATWQDGPEYAPLERPDEFALPAAPALEIVPPASQPVAPAPVERPAFTEPSSAVPPLATLVPRPQDPRDPQRPFDVVSSSVTAAGAWGSAHGSTPSALPAVAAATSTPTAEPTWSPGWPGANASSPAGSPPGWPNTAAPVPSRLSPAAPTSAAPGTTPPWPATPASTFAPDPSAHEPFPTAPHATSPGGFPQPGTPQWFGPGPYVEQPRPGPVDARQVVTAATPGLLICLAVGAVIAVLAPVLLAVAFVLSKRVKIAEAAVRRTHAIGLGAAGTFALIGVLSDPISFSDWWTSAGTWSLLICWAVLITTVAQVYRALKARSAPPVPPTYRGPWG